MRVNTVFPADFKVRLPDLRCSEQMSANASITSCDEGAERIITHGEPVMMLSHGPDALRARFTQELRLFDRVEALSRDQRMPWQG